MVRCSLWAVPRGKAGGEELVVMPEIPEGHVHLPAWRWAQQARSCRGKIW